MSNHPRRYYGSNQLHFITCSCYHRQAWLASPQRRDLFLAVFEEVRQRYGFVVVGYVAMPDHIHLLIRESEKGDPSRVMQAIKQGFSRRVLKSVAGPPLRVLQRWGLMQPASRFSTRDRRPHRSHLYKERKGGPATRTIVFELVMSGAVVA